MNITTSLPADITPHGSDYEIVSRVVEMLTENYRDQPSLEVDRRRNRPTADATAEDVHPLGRTVAEGIPAGGHARPRQAPAAAGGAAAA